MPDTFAYNHRLKRWGTIRDALGVSPAAEEIPGLSVVDTDEHEIGGVTSVELEFESVDAVEAAISRLEDTVAEVRADGCYDEADDAVAFKSALSKWHRQDSDLPTETEDATDPSDDSEAAEAAASDIYRDGAKHDKCKWERAWGELNAALHARSDAADVVELAGGDSSVEKSTLEEIIAEFSEIAEKHGVETYEECWNGEIDECDDHEVSPPG